MKRWFLVLMVLFFWLFTYFGLMNDGTYAQYLNPKFWYLVVVVPVVLVLFIWAWLFFQIERHSHLLPSGGETVSLALILLLPIAYLQSGGGNTLDASSFQNRNTSGAVQNQANGLIQNKRMQSEKLDPIDGIPGVSLAELVQDPEVYLGKSVYTLGQVYVSPQGETMLFRFAVTCCAADGIPMGVRLVGAQPEHQTWLRAFGTLLPTDNSGDVKYEFKVRQFSVVPTPKQPYLFLQAY